MKTIYSAILCLLVLTSVLPLFGCEKAASSSKSPETDVAVDLRVFPKVGFKGTWTDKSTMKGKNFDGSPGSLTVTIKSEIELKQLSPTKANWNLLSNLSVAANGMNYSGPTFKNWEWSRAADRLGNAVDTKDAPQNTTVFFQLTAITHPIIPDHPVKAGEGWVSPGKERFKLREVAAIKNRKFAVIECTSSPGTFWFDLETGICARSVIHVPGQSAGGVPTTNENDGWFTDSSGVRWVDAAQK